ncbi:L-2-amino-thiazoline-4-carboxylic acid hydrolase, partial [bacterium]|nr:L-2-amino-thiazoline-4-carboxylic acid hydrolase [bacterium]
MTSTKKTHSSHEPHWNDRPEPRWKDFKFNQPYAKGLRRLKEDVLGKTNFDPATLWQWGTMQAMALIEILKAVERDFGADGQKLIFESMRKVGYDMGRQMTEGTTIPEGMTKAEWTSYYCTIINRIAYASLETPEIESDDCVSFHIDWCPHQDHYAAMDCRVQRYFVQGMIEAAADFRKKNGDNEDWDVAFETTIPAGAETCFFRLHGGNPDE